MRIEMIVRLVEALIGLADLLMNLLGRLDEPKAPKGKDGDKKDGDKKDDGKEDDGKDDVREFC